MALSAFCTELTTCCCFPYHQTSGGCNAGPEFMSVPRQFQRFGIFWWRMMQVRAATVASPTATAPIEFPLFSFLSHCHPSPLPPSCPFSPLAPSICPCLPFLFSFPRTFLSFPLALPPSRLEMLSALIFSVRVEALSMMPRSFSHT